MEDQLDWIDKHLHKIRQDAAKGLKDIEFYAKDNVEKVQIADYERGFINRIEQFKEEINNELDDLRESVLSQRPSPGDPAYSVKLSKYQQFLRHATTGIQSMKKIFAKIFAKLYEALKSILIWIYEHRTEIILLIASLFVAILPLLLN